MFGKPGATEKSVRQAIGAIAAWWTAGGIADGPAAREARLRWPRQCGTANAAGLLNTLAMSTVARVATVLWTILEFAQDGGCE
jgi:hypothetical protein